MTSDPETRSLRRALALAYLAQVREDFRQRVELKQKVVISYGLAAGAIVGFVFKDGLAKPIAADLLFAVPLIATAAAILFADHMLATTGVALPDGSSF